MSDLAGATAIEYAMIASLISIVIFTACEAMGSKLVGMFQAVVAGF